MMNCAPTTGTGPESDRKSSSNPFSKNVLYCLLSCLFVALFFTAIPLIDSASASYDRKLSKRDPFLFHGTLPPATEVARTIENYTETGVASWYGGDFHGRRTSSGERYDMHEMTAAHRQLPMDTMLLVKNLENGKEAIVRVNDRGPFAKGRIIDLSQSAAKALKLERKGTARVTVVALSGSAEPLQAPPQDKSFDEAGSGFYIQVGAFANETNAMKVQKRLSAAGHPTTVSTVSGTKATIHKVLIFAGKDRDEALLAKRTLQQKGHKGAFVLTM